MYLVKNQNEDTMSYKVVAMLIVENKKYINLCNYSFFMVLFWVWANISFEKQNLFFSVHQFGNDTTIELDWIGELKRPICEEENEISCTGL